MEDKLSIWSLVLNASLVVQLVMLLLLLASFLSWVMIFQRNQVMRKAHRALRQFEDRFWSGIDLGQLFREVSQTPDAGSGAENIFRAGLQEYTRLTQKADSDPDMVMNGVQRAMRVAMAREEERLERHLPFLATVGSTSPYVGLFGTVWGIMNAFRGLANVHQATLASVAPGISEALVATAIGLFAAIPAVIAYNRFSSQSEGLLSAYDTFADEFSSILYRRVHRAV
ncbi:MAG: protein TolQ [Oceanospirillales bacterium]|uniref:Tol-Pal system protein TolQ n=1 Tax=Marinobacterium halophilum TaxID=267374 RepID=A0A2P8EV85_9GAMM|nr:protein TolQ [Marinobacterium halophilum]MBR9830006.1 protein TolQ [Oceanospirillales bacterium]PSL13376.1 cell division and transport-associated protein TolQ [Marinobacterium halophilum]